MTKNIKEELLWIFLHKVPDRFLNTDIFNSSENSVKIIPGRFIKTPKRSDKNSMRNVFRDHRVPVRYLK